MSEPDQRVTPALDAFLAGDTVRLQAAIDADPEVVNLVWNGNTLIEWATQPPHGIDPAVIAVLIASGATLDRALNLAGCWNLAGLCRQLLAAGADPAARADADITPLESAAMHGSTDSAGVLIEHGLHRPSLWLAAATGRLDLVQEWVSPDRGLLKPPGPYRPNLADIGRPPGPEPTDDPGEIIGEAFVHAAANGRVAVVDYLLAAGADIDARPYNNTTGLHFAIHFAKTTMVGHLLHLGASTRIEDDEYRSTAAGWAEACLGQNPASEQIKAVVDAASRRPRPSGR
jgi:ankyrin repeat protein